MLSSRIIILTPPTAPFVVLLVNPHIYRRRHTSLIFVLFTTRRLTFKRISWKSLLDLSVALSVASSVKAGKVSAAIHLDAVTNLPLHRSARLLYLPFLRLTFLVLELSQFPLLKSFCLILIVDSTRFSVRGYPLSALLLFGCYARSAAKTTMPQQN
jgi:hypothetical protein